MEIPTWEMAKALADKLPGEKSKDETKETTDPKQSQSQSACDVAEQNKQSIRGMGGRI